MVSLKNSVIKTFGKIKNRVIPILLKLIYQSTFDHFRQAVINGNILMNLIFRETTVIQRTFNTDTDTYVYLRLTSVHTMTYLHN